MVKDYKNLIVLVKGGGDLGSGVAWKLSRSGFKIAVSDIENPLCIRRQVCFAEAINSGETTVDGISARKITRVEEINWDIIPVFTSTNAEVFNAISADIIIDATLKNMKKPQTCKGDSEFTIGLGPGFRAPDNIDCVIETNRGHDLGRVIWEGEAQAFTGIPGSIEGHTIERLIRAPSDGTFQALKNIGDKVTKDDLIGWINRTELKANIDGIIRGLIPDGSKVYKDLKMGDIDPRGQKRSVYTISDKARNIGGGVLEAILHWINFKQ